MKFKTLILLFSATILAFSCKKSKLKDELTGKWQLIKNTNSAIEFTSDNTYHFYIGEIDVTMAITGEMGWKYDIIRQNDSLFVLVTDNLDSIMYKGFPEIKNDTLSLTFFEKAPGMSNYSKITGVYKRTGIEPQN